MRLLLPRILLPTIRRSIMTDIHIEGLARIHAPLPVDRSSNEKNAVFLNPVQCYNRDLSVLAINTFCDMAVAEKEAKQKQKRPSKKRFNEDGISSSNKKRKVDSQVVDAIMENDGKSEENGESSTLAVKTAEKNETKTNSSGTFTIFEGLAATGLRSIRYALEIPRLKWVMANDLSKTAVEAMRQNVQLNRDALKDDEKDRSADLDKVRLNEGDCLSIMYGHRTGKDRFNIIDLDPYGTAAPFLDASVQSVADGGLLCITCTDLAVLASSNYPEKCFTNYGGVPIKAEYCHEGALRLLLHTVSTSAARYGRYIQPLLSLSIDFYIRVFVRVQTGALQTKDALINTATVNICSYCQASTMQPLGRKDVIAKKGAVDGADDKAPANPNIKHKIAQVLTNGSHCDLCGSQCHIAGPMWSGDLHNIDFVTKMLEKLEQDNTKYSTATRIKGMLTIARKELATPFYFTPAIISSTFKCSCPPLATVVNALLHAGHHVSRSHASHGSLKTTAPRTFINDLFREWIKTSAPVNMNNISESSPARKLLAAESNSTINFEKHEGTADVLMSNVKLVFYQANPANWGPGKKAISGKGNNKQAEALLA